MTDDGTISPEAQAAGEAAAIAVGAVEQSQEEEAIAQETRDAAVDASITAEVAAETAANAETTAEVAAEVGIAAGTVAVEADAKAEEAKSEIQILREETAAGFAALGDAIQTALAPKETTTAPVEEVATDGASSGGNSGGTSGDKVGDGNPATAAASGTGKTGDSSASSGETRRRGFGKHHR